MQRTYKKQTVKDFDKRVRRVDPAFSVWGEAAYAQNTRPYRPFLSLLFGGVWLYLVAALLHTPLGIQQSLQRGFVPVVAHAPVLTLLTSFVIMTALLTPVFFVRCLRLRNPRYRNSRMIFLGAVIGAGLWYLPETAPFDSLTFLEGPAKEAFAQAKMQLNLSLRQIGTLFSW